MKPEDKQTPDILPPTDNFIPEKTERRGRKKGGTNQTKKSSLGDELFQYSESLANLVDDNAFVLEKNEAENLGRNLEKMLDEFDIDISNKVSSVLSVIFLVTAISLRRKKSIIELVKKWRKNDKPKNEQKADI